MMKFDPQKQIMDFVRVSELTPEVERSVKEAMQKQIDEIIPARYRDRVVWITRQWPAEIFRVKDDNYLMFGLTKDKIGTEYKTEECWTIAWKYNPL